MYIITKRFTGGILNGLTIEEHTSVYMPVGLVVSNTNGSPYVVEAVQEAGGAK